MRDLTVSCRSRAQDRCAAVYQIADPDQGMAAGYLSIVGDNAGGAKRAFDHVLRMRASRPTDVAHRDPRERVATGVVHDWTGVHSDVLQRYPSGGDEPAWVRTEVRGIRMEMLLSAAAEVEGLKREWTAAEQLCK
ncbi:hypothetical protein BN10_740005 [Phycicoccus elongatus Lp2]|uniref:Uncharacterized protein n=1 Tax=Phycicoccus elongatus Lp2 TaxID=1193181 RepID=N0E205_9MICO|nr:hypothetical protein BN10_740005 [Phycicoccus elongatus Lp2]